MMIGFNVHLELTSRPRKDGRHMILLRLSKGREQKRRISTRVYVLKQNFNVAARFGCWVRTYDNEHIEKNRTLKRLVREAEELIHSKKGQEDNLTLNKIAESLTNQGSNVSFTEYFKQNLDLMRTAKQVSTLRRYNLTYTKLLKFMGGRKLEFADITLSFLKRYEAYLQSSGLGVNTISKELCVIRTMIYRAIKENLFKQQDNPFFSFKLKSKKTNKMRLTYEELKKIESIELEEDSSLWHTRNYFLFCLYNAGIRWGDFCKLKWHNIQDGRLIYTMHKTGVIKSLMLLPQSLAILDHYRDADTEPDDYIFPPLQEIKKVKDEFKIYNKISSQNCIANKNLKKIAKLVDIEKPISTHISRHSFAAILQKKGTPIPVISKALGHSNYKITEIYLNSMETEVVDDAIKTVFLL